MGCQSEPCRGKGCNFPGRRPVPEFLEESEHVVADSGQEPGCGCPGDDGPAVSPGDAFGSAQHDRLADASGARDDGQKARRSGTLLQAVLELVQKPGPSDQCRALLLPSAKGFCPDLLGKRR